MSEPLPHYVQAGHIYYPITIDRSVLRMAHGDPTTREIELLKQSPPDLSGRPPATLPTDSQERKDIPIVRGCLDYFPAALAEIAKVSKAGNDKHNPGQPMHHARGKSTDHADCIARHLFERGTIDPEDGLRHSAKVAWRALALLQEELEDAGAPLARGAKVAPDHGAVYVQPFPRDFMLDN